MWSFLWLSTLCYFCHARYDLIRLGWCRLCSTLKTVDVARFCEVSCVKYCVFTFPLVVTAVQTHGGVQSALQSIHAPTRNEEGTYIRASVASDLDTLSTLNTPSHQVMMMNIFLLGGWVVHPSAFLFCGFPVFALSYSVWLGRTLSPVFRSAFRCRLTCSKYSLFQLVA